MKIATEITRVAAAGKITTTTVVSRVVAKVSPGKSCVRVCQVRIFFLPSKGYSLDIFSYFVLTIED